MHPESDPALQLQGAPPDLFFDAAAYGIVILHVNGTVLRVNRTFCEIFRYSKDDLQGHYLDELIVPAESYETLWQRYWTRAPSDG